MITVILLIVSIGLNAALGWTTYVQYSKNEEYEQELVETDERVQKIFERISTVLHTMRTLDEKRMFESDDEVGTVFQQLTDVVNSLRPMIYGVQDEER